jgi:hypothetical protein
MTRQKCKAILPVIQAFAEGKCIEYWDSMQIVASFQRGMRKTADNIGFGSSISDYRMIEGGVIRYFDGRPSVTDTLNKYKF